MQEVLDIQKPDLALLAGGEIRPEQHFAIAPASLPRLTARVLLIPFDFSKSAVELLRGVVPFAKQTGAIIHLLHVIEPAIGGENSHAVIDDQLAEVSESMLKIWAARIVRNETKTFASVRVFASVRIGHLADEVIARAQSIRADLILLNGDAGNPPRALILRGAVERICRSAPCPALIVPETCVESFARDFDGFPASNWKRILMPVDFTPAAALALRYAAAITIENRAALTVLNSAPNRDGLSSPDGSLKKRRDALARQVQHWMRGELNFQLPCKIRVPMGGSSLASMISGANQEGSDLLILPTRAGEWLRRFRMGSATEGLLRHSRCAILSIQEHIKPREE